MAQFPFILEKISDLTLQQIQFLLLRASEFKYQPIANPPSWASTENPVTVASLFLENSTRTKFSFHLAALNLGARFLHLDAKSSSLEKGEDLEQTFLTLLHLGIDLCVFRTPNPNDLSNMKSNPPLKIINAGDGGHEHPSQALIDLFTMMEIGHPPHGKTITIIGDCAHSRVCNSLLSLLPLFDAKLYICAPQPLLPQRTLPPSVQILSSVEEAIEQSDMIYLLRPQRERHEKDYQNKSKSKKEKNNQLDENFWDNYSFNYGITLDRLKKCDKFPLIFHAGPANIGMEISQDLIRSPYYMGHMQVQHSIFLRMGLLDAMIGPYKEHTEFLKPKKSYPLSLQESNFAQSQGDGPSIQ